ncbi:MAG: LamG-like jellyroll fold domain-containing protein [Candidatus Paceibacterota bacterium]|jgi:prepilin-type N-terminal cleavage/methylation domain-containing protein
MNKRGFTLIELLVVIAIVGILSSVIYTNITGLRDRARITAGIRFDSSTLHSIGDQLVGEWLFDAPNVLLDSSGSGYNISTTSIGVSPTYYSTSGYNNKGTYGFDGGDYFVTALLPPSQATISAWTKNYMTDIMIYALAGSYTVGNDRSYLSIGSYTKNVCSGGVGNQNLSVIKGSTSVGGGVWHLCTLSYDGTTVKLYTDGKLEYSANQVGAPNITSPYFIGATNGGGAVNIYNGYLDDVRIYTSILSSSDIQKLYTEGLSTHQVVMK